MVEVINLKQVRKRKARADRERVAQENRARFGRSKADVLLERAQRAIDESRHEAHGRGAHNLGTHGLGVHRRDDDDDR